MIEYRMPFIYGFIITFVIVFIINYITQGYLLKKERLKVDWKTLIIVFFQSVIITALLSIL